MLKRWDVKASQAPSSHTTQTECVDEVSGTIKATSKTAWMGHHRTEQIQVARRSRRGKASKAE